MLQFHRVLKHTRIITESRLFLKAFPHSDGCIVALTRRNQPEVRPSLLPVESSPDPESAAARRLLLHSADTNDPASASTRCRSASRRRRSG